MPATPSWGRPSCSRKWLAACKESNADAGSEVEANNQMKTNLFGPMYSTQAVLPGMRARRTGTIVSVSSVAGQDAQPTCSIYAASKFALEGFNEALAREVKEFGVSVLIVEPGAFRTNFLAASNIGDITGYEDGIVGQTAKKFREANGKQPGDPRKAVEIIYEVATGEGAAGHLKGQILRLPLGPDCFTRVQNKVNSVQHDLDMTREIGSTTNL
jgi:NAD(P)-dependent dehydrogenase (short-subunit alcohol dehydrogenase family)